MAAPLSLSAVSLDVVVALAQRADLGARALARITGAAPTSVQNGLCLLASHGIAVRTGTTYALVPDHPAHDELIALALRLSDPVATVRIVLRASDVVEIATYDDGGFVIGTRANAARDAAIRLDTALTAIRRDRADDPHMLQFETEELARIMHPAIGLRTRVASGDLIKGGRRAGHSDAGFYTDRPGDRTQNRRREG